MDFQIKIEGKYEGSVLITAKNKKQAIKKCKAIFGEVDIISIKMYEAKDI